MRNPILFSLYLAAAPAVIISVITGLVYAGLKLTGGDLITLNIAVPYVIFYYILAAPVIAVAGFLYMAAKNPQWNRRYGWVIIIYTLIAFVFYRAACFYIY